MSYYDYTQPWDQRPGDVPGPNNLEQLLATTPALKRVAEQGWHEEYDQ